MCSPADAATAAANETTLHYTPIHARHAACTAMAHCQVSLATMLRQPISTGADRLSAAHTHAHTNTHMMETQQPTPQSCLVRSPAKQPTGTALTMPPVPVCAGAWHAVDGQREASGTYGVHRTAPTASAIQRRQPTASHQPTHQPKAAANVGASTAMWCSWQRALKAAGASAARSPAYHAGGGSRRQAAACSEAVGVQGLEFSPAALCGCTPRRHCLQFAAVSCGCCLQASAVIRAGWRSGRGLDSRVPCAPSAVMSE